MLSHENGFIEEPLIKKVMLQSGMSNAFFRISRNITTAMEVFADFTLNRILDFFLQRLFFHTRIVSDNCLLIVQIFEAKAFGYADSLFDLKFKLYPHRDSHAFKSHIQNMVEYFLFNHPDHRPRHLSG